MRHLWVLAAAMLLLVVMAAPAQAQAQYPNGYYGSQQGAVLSPQDQQQFDKYYAKWQDATRKNDQDDIASNARHMQDIMARYNISPNVPFDRIASNAGGYGPNAAYPNAYPPNGAYPGGYPAYGQARLSPEDQRNFDKYYSRWLDAQRKNDRDDIDGNARHMQDIMARYNIPSNVPFAAIATNGAAAAPNGGYGYPGAYGYGQSAQRLSPKDQRDFDNYYRKWVDAKRKRDIDDIDNNARKMQQIMARNNIPANVPFDRIASQTVAYEH